MLHVTLMPLCSLLISISVTRLLSFPPIKHVSQGTLLLSIFDCYRFMLSSPVIRIKRGFKISLPKLSNQEIEESPRW